MTGGATIAGSRCASQVKRMVESHIKTFERWKWFHRAGRNIRVTDGADGVARVVEALRVTAGTRRVTWKRKLRRVVFTPMADQARKRGVCLRVREL